MKKNIKISEYITHILCGTYFKCVCVCVVTSKVLLRVGVKVFWKLPQLHSPSSLSYPEDHCQITLTKSLLLPPLSCLKNLQFSKAEGQFQFLSRLYNVTPSIVPALNKPSLLSKSLFSKPKLGS